MWRKQSIRLRLFECLLTEMWVSSRSVPSACATTDESASCQRSFFGSRSMRSSWWNRWRKPKKWRPWTLWRFRKASIEERKDSTVLGKTRASPCDILDAGRRTLLKAATSPRKMVSREKRIFGSPIEDCRGSPRFDFFVARRKTGLWRRSASFCDFEAWSARTL